MSAPPPFIIGFDIATNLGIAEGFAGERPRLYSLNLSRPDDELFQPGGRAVKWLAQRLVVDKPDLIVIERPVMGDGKAGSTNANTKFILQGLVYLFGSVCAAKKIRLMLVAVSSVRKSFIGNGALPSVVAKRQVFEQCNRLGWEPPNRDASDAAACWFFGCKTIAPDLTAHVEPLLLKLNSNQGAI